MSDDTGRAGGPDNADEVGSVTEEAAKLLGALSGWAKTHARVPLLSGVPGGARRTRRQPGGAHPSHDGGGEPVAGRVGADGDRGAG